VLNNHSNDFKSHAALRHMGTNPNIDERISVFHSPKRRTAFLELKAILARG
jgi:hypothetical protein